MNEQVPSKEIVSAWITRAIGTRCRRAHYNCTACRAWEAFDATAEWPAHEPPDECSRCRGSGEVRAMTQEHGPDDYEFDAECPECKGVGVVSRASQPPSSEDARDAARYRFLRQPNHAIVYARDPNAWGHNTPGHIRYNTPEQLDAAIDAACSGTTKGENHG